MCDTRGAHSSHALGAALGTDSGSTLGACTQGAHSGHALVARSCGAHSGGALGVHDWPTSADSTHVCQNPSLGLFSRRRALPECVPSTCPECVPWSLCAPRAFPECLPRVNARSAGPESVPRACANVCSSFDVTLRWYTRELRGPNLGMPVWVVSWCPC